MQKDYYSILNVDRESSQGDIKKAYRRLALVMFPQKFHPDKNSGEDTTAEFQKISEAYCSDTNLGVTPPGQWTEGGKAVDPAHIGNRDEIEPVPDLATPAAADIPGEPPPSLDAIRKRSEHLNTLLSEVIGELELRLRMCQELERFPELEEFANKHLSLRCNVLVCGLCRRDLAVEPRWHFESVHYDEFLYWLDIKAKVEARRRRRRLVSHLRQVKSQKAIKD